MSINKNEDRIGEAGFTSYLLVADPDSPQLGHEVEVDRRFVVGSAKDGPQSIRPILQGLPGQ